MAKLNACILPAMVKHSAHRDKAELRDPERFRGLTGRVVADDGETIAIEFPGMSDWVAIERRLASIWEAA